MLPDTARNKLLLFYFALFYFILVAASAAARICDVFITAVEILATKIWEDNNIKDFKIGQEILKLSSFVDDMTCCKCNELAPSLK